MAGNVLRISMVILLLLVLPAISASAQQEMTISIEPQEGPPGTIVTIHGEGAPPNADVSILTAPFSDEIDCLAGRGASVVAQIRADESGRFSATHEAVQLNMDQRGYTYLAKRLIPETPQPQSNLECFTFNPNARFFPETGHTISGRFLSYWEDNGGLMVFGYPLTEAHLETTSSGERLRVQYFERQRFERHRENPRPYDVLLGRLGAELLTLRGTPPETIPPAPGPVPGCLYVSETGHNVCNQEPGRGFMTYWQSHGLDFGDPGVSYRESLALFGYPLTEAYLETNSSGDSVLTQWFERARFEWHPNNPDEFKVLLGRLGAELLEAQQR
ncbi:MAG: hypothetical protein KatS3mg057_2745 [Herpetosiphonaceae bacterium]|nr:MAG: hypothetical protein KatS3mg057_2745 [Herpetosiphonaceae bacterium]